jgi:alkylresorcinol/alkylpyrone synthase
MYFVEEELGLDRARTQPSWDVLANFGNLSSASVLFVLNQWMERQPPAPGEYGLLAAFGPGFSAELLLLQWT